MAIVNITDKEDYIIENVLHSLREYAYGDILKASNGGAKMGAFILCSCLIDAIVGFIIGKDTTGKDYEEFVNNNLKNYNGKKLYTDLRCKLVHSYSEGGSYNFIDAKPNFHLKTVENKTNINLEDFIKEIETYLKEFETNARNKENKELRKNIVIRHNTNGIIHVKTVKTGSFQYNSSTSAMGMTTGGYSLSASDQN
jgi:hypothetical protein